MRDISHKIRTLRIATAVAELKMEAASVAMVRDNTGPKPDMPATARAAAYLAVKNTANVIPHCHPIPVESVKVDFEYQENALIITVIAKSIYRTGCEMEALHGASVAALTIYDMLKPIDAQVEIGKIYLKDKKGGKSDFGAGNFRKINAAVIVCSDTVSAGRKEDGAGKAIIAKLEDLGVDIEAYEVIPDHIETISGLVSNHIDQHTDLIITTGGTGLGPKDITVEAVKPLIQREIPGIMEAARSHGQERTPYAMLSRGIAGMTDRSLILCLPGSTKGAQESMDALFPSALHITKVIEKGYRHEDMQKRD